MEQKSGGKFRVGMKVWLEHTREEAVITRIDKTGVLYVQAGAHVIPVFMSQVSKRLPDAPKVDMPEAEKAEVAPRRAQLPKTVIDATKIAKPRVCLLFIPQRLKDGEIVRYEIGLLNETSEPFKAVVTIVRNSDEEPASVILNKTDYAPVKRIEGEAINDIVAVRLLLSPADLLLDVFETDVKIKPASFIKKSMVIPSLAAESFTYELLEQFEKAPVRKDVFKEVSKKIKEQDMDETESPWKLDHLRQLILDKPLAKETKLSTTPEKEIDLHTDAFLVDTNGLNATDILLLQLERFRKSLDRAIMSGQKMLLVVHGVGKGKLKKEIENILRDNEHVVDFHDASYPKYGYGATEVHLK